MRSRAPTANATGSGDRHKTTSVKHKATSKQRQESKEAPEMHAAVLRYRVMAYITGVVLIVLCFVGIPLQIAGYPAVANDVGVLHGILYIINPALAAAPSAEPVSR